MAICYNQSYIVEKDYQFTKIELSAKAQEPKKVIIIAYDKLREIGFLCCKLVQDAFNNKIAYIEEVKVASDYPDKEVFAALFEQYKKWARKESKAQLVGSNKF